MFILRFHIETSHYSFNAFNLSCSCVPIHLNLQWKSRSIHLYSFFVRRLLWMTKAVIWDPDIFLTKEGHRNLISNNIFNEIYLHLKCWSQSRGPKTGNILPISTFCTDFSLDQAIFICFLSTNRQSVARNFDFVKNREIFLDHSFSVYSDFLN